LVACSSDNTVKTGVLMYPLAGEPAEAT